MRRAPVLLLLGLVLGWGAARAQPAEEVTRKRPMIGPIAPQISPCQ
ncbi:MAG: hypothetical protein AB2813_08085 [Candidatus Sedimenticola endophacoides]